MFTQTVRQVGVRALLVVAVLAIAAASASAHPDCSPARFALAEGARVQLELSDCIRERIREARVVRLESLRLVDRMELGELRELADRKLVHIRGLADRIEIGELSMADHDFNASDGGSASSWVDTFAALAKLPAQGAVVAQRIIVTFAKALPRIAQAIF